jgi:magnesium-transporting ATPase (P-type)
MPAAPMATSLRSRPEGLTPAEAWAVMAMLGPNASRLRLMPEVLPGVALTEAADEALSHRVETTDIFAEIDPGQKERIVRALQHHGHAVTHLGDGINDAPR